MRLLIVDDEKLTRDGLQEALPLKDLGIQEVYTAKDGEAGLALARKVHPDLVLTDVRMPHMDGIAMVTCLEEELPCCAFIFMSGYSDKAYLKAAIRLKAINYVEKPLDIQEVTDALKSGIEAVQRMLQGRESARLFSHDRASSLAYLLTRPYKEHREKITELSGELGLPLHAGTHFLVLLIQTGPGGQNPLSLQDVLSELEMELQAASISIFYLSKYLQYHVFYFISEASLPPALMKGSAERLRKGLSEDGPSYLCLGQPATGISHASRSYTSAVALLQSAFFFPPNYLLTPDDMKKAPLGDRAWVSEFQDALLHRQDQTLALLLTDLEASYSCNTTLLVHKVKDLYYKLFMAVEEARRQLRPSLPPDSDTIMLFLESCFSYEELHARLNDKVDRLLHALQTSTSDEPVIFQIKEYIAANYGNEMLSVREISDHVFLSATYVCTYFKNATGQTINQYLTDFRMEKAKQMLADPRYQIGDIASRTGYSNSNYFAKSFRRATGLSPTEYREKIS